MELWLTAQERDLNGNGPCNQQRLNHHKKAHDDGQWVREAAKSYAQKQELIAN